MSITSRAEHRLWTLIAKYQPGEDLDLINWVHGYQGNDSVRALESAEEHGMIEHIREAHYRVLRTTLPRALAQRYANLSAAVGLMELPPGDSFDYEELRWSIGSLLNELVKDP